MITVEHISPLVYGGVVTLAKWYDQKRVDDGKVTKKEVLKLYGFWSFLAIGTAALAGTIWWKKYQGWTDKLTSGFLFGLPGFIYDTMKATSGTASRANSADAVAQAQQILAAKRAQALASGKATERTYEPQFNQVGVT